jgi:hypothetical protein
MFARFDGECKQDGIAQAAACRIVRIAECESSLQLNQAMPGSITDWRKLRFYGTLRLP